MPFGKRGDTQRLKNLERKTNQYISTPVSSTPTQFSGHIQNMAERHDVTSSVAGLVPVFDETVPAAGGYLAWLQRVPDRADGGPHRVRLQLAVHLRRLVVPEPKLAGCVPAHQELPIRREAHLASVAAADVAAEYLLTQLLELLARSVNDDLKSDK